MLIGWLVKRLVLRYGGTRLYRQVLSFFLGLVIGDYAVASLWVPVPLVSSRSGYRAFPL